MKTILVALTLLLSFGALSKDETKKKNIFEGSGLSGTLTHEVREIVR